MATIADVVLGECDGTYPGGTPNFGDGQDPRAVVALVEAEVLAQARAVLSGDAALGGSPEAREAVGRLLAALGVDDRP